MRPEYDFSKGVRGKYAGRTRGAGNMVLIEPDLCDLFPDARSVNRVLRGVAAIVKATGKRPTKPKS
jgi:hypothetical protein